MEQLFLARLFLLLLIPSAYAWADCPGVGRLEEALQIVGESYAPLQSARVLAAEQARKPNWSLSVTVGYSISDIIDEDWGTGAGANAAIRLRIPIGDNASAINAAKERAEVARNEDQVRAAIMDGITNICEQAHKVRALKARADFMRDRLGYRQERVEQGLDPADSLWGDAQAYQEALHTYQEEKAKLDTQRLMLARRYGGDQWPRLKALLESMTR